jgi:hypothetical protein
VQTDGDVTVFGAKGDYTPDKTLTNMKTGRTTTEKGKWDIDPTIVSASGSAKIDGAETSAKIGDGTITAAAGQIEVSGSASVTPTSVSAEAEIGSSVFHTDYKSDKIDADLDVFAAEAKGEAKLDLKKGKAEVGGEIGAYLAKADASGKIDIGPIEITLGVNGAVGAAAGVEGKIDLKKGVAKWSTTLVAGVGGGFDIGFSLKGADDPPSVVPVRNATP